MYLGYLKSKCNKKSKQKVLGVWSKVSVKFAIFSQLKIALTPPPHSIFSSEFHPRKKYIPAHYTMRQVYFLKQDKFLLTKICYAKGSNAAIAIVLVTLHI